MAPVSLDEQLRQFVGQRYRGPRVSLDPVDEAMIRHLCETLGDDNPIYTDPEAAAASVHGGIVAPPATLQVWSMSGYHPAVDPHDRQPDLTTIMEEAGYVGVVATNCDQEYVRYLRPGDRITMVSDVESIVGPKQTGLGEGYFVNTVETYTDQHGEVVGRMRFRLLRYIPKKRDEAAPSTGTGTRPRPSTNQDNAFFWEGVEQGELRIQRCSDCKRLRHPAQPACPHCQSLDWDFVVASGKGEVYSWVVHHHPPLPGFTTPYAVALVELEEGVRMVGEVDADPDTVTIGLPVQVVFTQVDDELTVPQWEPR
jgi:hypothetical protein